MKIRKEITHENYIVEIEDPILYVDNRKRGRSRHMSHAPAEFVYISENAAGWDEGTLIASKKNVRAYYSNNVNLHDENGNFLLIQYSDT